MGFHSIYISSLITHNNVSQFPERISCIFFFRFIPTYFLKNVLTNIIFILNVIFLLFLIYRDTVHGVLEARILE